MQYQYEDGNVEYSISMRLEQCIKWYWYAAKAYVIVELVLHVVVVGIRASHHGNHSLSI